MDRIPLVTSSSIIPVDKFWTSVLVYHNRPHLVNRRLAGVSQILLCEISLYSSSIKRLSEIFTREALLYEIRRLDSLHSIRADFIKNITETYDKEVVIKETNWGSFDERIEGHFVSVRVLFPRTATDKCVEVVVFDKEKNTATFFAVQEHDSATLAPKFPYDIELTRSGNLRIILKDFEDAETNSGEWLADRLFAKLLKWVDFEDDKMTHSLNLVSVEEYCTSYAALKSKYSESLVRQWLDKTGTDPQKYIFEDIAIATYLICLWRKLGANDVNFVDCGCGNGLLVYILNKEGFPGRGYDTRQRRAWNLYAGEADLKIGTLSPESRFPDATWIIGNHSDELTPWIPIIALNSSPKTNFFVLPCCSYELSGQKYVRANHAVSQYRDYIDYVENISVMCGFTTLKDRLKIPSTRRSCLVGIREKHTEPQIDDIKEKVSGFINERISKFIPRKPTENVRNCTQLERNVKERIVALVVNELLEVRSPLSGGRNGSLWNQGGTKSLRELIKKLSPEDKLRLKHECGGLQTLLKNHRYIFEVSGGNVRVRKPISLEESSKYKDKPCWFVQNHPDGCIHQSETCGYNHLDNDNY